MKAEELSRKNIPKLVPKCNPYPLYLQKTQNPHTNQKNTYFSINKLHQTMISAQPNTLITVQYGQTTTDSPLRKKHGY